MAACLSPPFFFPSPFFFFLFFPFFFWTKAENGLEEHRPNGSPREEESEEEWTQGWNRRDVPFPFSPFFLVPSFFFYPPVFPLSPLSFPFSSFFPRVGKNCASRGGTSF